MSEHIVSADSLGIGGARRVVATVQQLQDLRTYQRLKSEATSLGVELEIIGESEYATLHGTKPEAPAKPDEDGCIVDANGARILVISQSDVESRGGHRKYLAAKTKASELGVELQIVPDPDEAA
jgi:hypothetical protein